jgi:hypothetical protein
MNFPHAIRPLLISAAFLAALLPPARAVYVKEITVGVRADVEWQGAHKLTAAEIQAAKEHQRIYVIAEVKQIASPENMVRPVDARAVAAELKKGLAKGGYREARPDQRPEIFFIVFYGRGWLPNPYAEGLAPAANGIEFSPDHKHAMRERLEPNFEEKLQRANNEKLFVSVSALKFPAQAGEKPQRLWKTVMVVDDPDHRDLNAVLPAMFDAGVSFFGQRMEQDEAEVAKPLPEGRVELGTPTIIEDKKPAPK